MTDDRWRPAAIVTLVVLVVAGAVAGVLVLRARPSANDRFLNHVATIAKVDRKIVDVHRTDLLARRDAVCGNELVASARQADEMRASVLITSAYQAALLFTCPSRRGQFDQARAVVTSERAKKNAAAALRTVKEQAAATLLLKALRDDHAGDVSLAKRELQQVVNEDPKNKYGWYNLGVIAQFAGDTGKAGSDYLKVIAIDPKFEGALYNYGILRYTAGDTPAAIVYLRRATVVSPDDADAHWNLGLALAKDAKTAAERTAARSELDKALRLDPKLPSQLAAGAGQ